MKFCYQFFLLVWLVAPAFADRVYVIEGNNALTDGDADWVTLENGSTDPGAQEATNFGTQDFNFSSFKEFRIQNTGSQSVTFNDGESDESQFRVLQTEAVEEIDFPLTLESGEEFSFRVRFIPDSREEVTARIRFRSANANGGFNDYRFRVGGSGAGGEIQVQGRGDSGLDFIPISSELNATFLRENGTLFQPTNASGSRIHEFTIENVAEGIGDPLVKDSLRISEAVMTGEDRSQFEIIGIADSVELGGDGDDIQLVSFQIQYNPTEVGTHTATFEISTNDLQSYPFQFRVQGISPPLTDFAITGRPSSTGATDFLPIFSAGTDGVDPTAENGTLLPTTSVGSLSESFVQLENSGDEILFINSIIIEGDFADQFRVVDIPDTISEGSAGTFGIVFEPSSNGLKTATITIDTNDQDGGIFTFSISGTSTAPVIEISGQADFGEVGLNKTATQIFLISNSGSEDLILSSAAINDAEEKDVPEWSIPFQDFPVTIEPGASFDLEIAYSPGDVDADPVTLVVESNDPLESTLSLDLTGEAILEAELSVLGVTTEGAELAISDGDTSADQTVTDFGAVELDETVTKTFRILSGGTTDLTVASISSTHPSFAVEGTPGIVASGDSLEFTITYTPSLVTDEVTSISIESDGIGESASYTFSLRGTGTGAKLAIYGGLVSEEALIGANELTASSDNLTDFGVYYVGGAPIVLPFIVKNIGDSELTLSDISSFNPLFEALLDSTEFPITLSPSEERFIEFSFAAESAQEAISILDFETNDRSVAGGSYAFAVRASAEQASPEVADLEVSVSEDRQVPSTPNAAEVVDLWYLAGATVSESSLTLSNTGDADLIIRAITSSNPSFTLDFDLLTIAPGATSSLVISNDPAAETGAQETTLKIYSSDAGASVYTVNIRTNFVEFPEITEVKLNQEGELIVGLSDLPTGFNLTTTTDLESQDWEAFGSEDFTLTENPVSVNLGELSSNYPEDQRRFFRLELKGAGE